MTYLGRKVEMFSFVCNVYKNISGSKYKKMRSVLLHSIVLKLVWIEFDLNNTLMWKQFVFIAYRCHFKWEVILAFYPCLALRWSYFSVIYRLVKFQKIQNSFLKSKTCFLVLNPDHQIGSSAWVSSGNSGFLPQLSGKWWKDYKIEYSKGQVP